MKSTLCCVWYYGCAVLCCAVLLFVSVLCGIVTAVVGSEVLCLCGVVMWLLTELYH